MVPQRARTFTKSGNRASRHHCSFGKLQSLRNVTRRSYTEVAYTCHFRLSLQLFKSSPHSLDNFRALMIEVGWAQLALTFNYSVSICQPLWCSHTTIRTRFNFLTLKIVCDVIAVCFIDFSVKQLTLAELSPDRFFVVRNRTVFFTSPDQNFKEGFPDSAMSFYSPPRNPQGGGESSHPAA